MSIVIDQTGRRVYLNHLPQRIISLVPSQTELLFDLGLDEKVVGITKFCIRPQQWFKTKTKIGGTKTLSLEAIDKLNPDIVLANREENIKQEIEALEKKYPVWISDIHNLDQALEMIQAIGTMTGSMVRAEELKIKIRMGFASLPTSHSGVRTAYLIWRNPYMAAGNDTFINDIMERAGFDNIFRSLTRYPEISLKDLKENNCELLLLSSEPFPFQEKHIAEIKKDLPNIRIQLVDGEMFSWYGSRLVYVPAYLGKLRKEIENE